MKTNKTTLTLVLILALCLVVLGVLVYILVVPGNCQHHECFTTQSAPTCDQKGYTLYICKACGYNFEADFIAPLGHTYTSETVAPTCDTEGYDQRTCLTCGNTEKDNYTASTGHTYTSTVYSPTCEAQGYTLKKCKNCSFSIKTSYVEPKGHTLTSKTVAPTCNDQGYTKHSCKNCNYSFTNNYTNPKGHSYTTTVVRPNIDQTGYTIYKCTSCNASHISDYVFYSDIFSGAEGDGRGEVAWGIDISKWSKDVDFKKLKAAGVDFVIIRVGSNVNKDPNFEAYYKAAKEAGLDVGAYFFTYAESKADAIADAKRVSEWLKGKKFEYPIFFDIEDDPNNSYYPSRFSEALITEMAQGFMTTMVENGYYPGLYTNNKFLYEIFNTERALRLYDVWLAHWINDYEDLVYEYSSLYSMWQYQGDVEGFAGAVEGMCDINYAFKNYPAIMKKHGYNGY